MSSRINTILIVGATTGIGEAFARRFHGLGKKVIITGRNQEKLKTLAQKLPGLETRQLHVDDLPSLGSNVNEILADFPSIDSVIINAGMQQSFNLFDPSTISPDTGLDKNHRDVVIGDEGGPDNVFQPMPLGEYVDKFFDAWEGAVRPDGSVKEEIGVGLGAVGVDTWRVSFGELFKGMGLST